MSVAVARSLAPKLELPPPFTLVTLRERGDAFAHACHIAPKAGAGTLVHVGRFDVVEFALVLEPEEPLREARRALFAGMAALADAIGAHCPPERAVTFDWPDAILFDGARIGGARLGWPKACAEDEVPSWLVFSAMLLAAKIGAGDPGLTPNSTSLEDERFSDTGYALVESFARYFLLVVDRWREEGFEAVAPDYLTRLRIPGRLDPEGRLLIDGPGEAPLVLPLLPALDEPAWLDPDLRAPRL